MADQLDQALASLGLTADDLDPQVLAALRDARRDALPSADHGTRSGPSSAGQLSRSQLRNMTPEQIDQARRDGRLDNLLKGHA